MLAGSLRGLIAVSLAFCVLSSVGYAQAQPRKTLRVGSYNVGHFNQGKIGGYQGADVQEALQRWKQWITKQQFDVFFIQEWNQNFDKAETINAKEALLDPLFKSVAFGKRNTWIYNGVATGFETTNFRQVTLTHKQYYITQVDWQWEGKTIVLMSVHVPWQKEHNSSFDMLIQELKKHEYFICAGDLNAPEENIVKLKAAGFNIANGGSEGWFSTSGKRKGTDLPLQHIDNIITSPNMTLRKISAPNTGLNDKDHFPILAEIVLP